MVVGFKERQARLLLWLWIRAGPGGSWLFVLPATALEDLPRRSDTFSRTHLAQLAERLAVATRMLAGFSASLPARPATSSAGSAPHSPG